MTHRFAEIAFTDSVKAVQERYRSRAQNERLQHSGDPHDSLGSRETDFIAARESFYMATVGESGWPYVQHRGGPAGFLRALGPKTLAFADFRGNTQLISAGNAAADDRVSLILVDYAERKRLKILGRIRFQDAEHADAQALGALGVDDYRARVERVATIDVHAFDWNCPQHIPRRFTEAEMRSALEPLQDRIVELEATIRALATSDAG
jgi:predicted pyridoxine 5'-phosphate oxidase superfamily flavin-nucleotide-binding protein